jgi:hypothetical protein
MAHSAALCTAGFRNVGADATQVCQLGVEEQAQRRTATWRAREPAPARIPPSLHELGPSASVLAEESLEVKRLAGVLLSC